MAAASLVATAFGIIILIITAYVLAGSTLATSEVVSTAQKDMTEIQVKMLGTSMEIQYVTIDNTTATIQVLNNGREPIRDLKYMDIYLYDDSTRAWSLFNSWSLSWTYTITPDITYPGQWDPGELLTVRVSYSAAIPGPEGIKYTKIVTSNGIPAGSPVPYSRS